MVMPTTNVPTEWTAEMVRALPDDGNRYEVLDGELFVTPAPSWAHQAVLAWFFLPLATYVQRHSLGWARWSPADMAFGRLRLVQPDLFVVPSRAEGEPRDWSEVRSLLLALEVLSPSTAFADRNRKREIYQQQGVGEYWIVDPDARLVERWHPLDTRPEIVRDVLAWQPNAGIEPLTLHLAECWPSRP